jgi:hypothetical protein
MFTIKPDEDLPRKLLHYDVIEAVRIPDKPGLLPRVHIVILRNDAKPEDRAYSTHDVAWQEGWNGTDGPWVLNAGNYDQPHMKAIRDLLKRSLEHMPTVMPPVRPVMP